MKTRKKAVYNKKYIILECNSKGKLRFAKYYSSYGDSLHDGEFNSEDDALQYAGKHNFHFGFVVVPKYVRDYFPE